MSDQYGRYVDNDAEYLKQIESRIETLLTRHGARDSAQPSPWGLTPQMAFRLLIAAEWISDMATEYPDMLGDDDVLPPNVLSMVSPEFIQRYLRCYSDLASRLELAGDLPGRPTNLATCTGDAVALAHVLRTAEDDHESGFVDDTWHDELTRLATNSQRDLNFEWYATNLFEDRDFEVLWRRDFDGVENDEFMAERLDYANLRIANWFLPFDDA